jgi:omega-6 fatty acid desaturase (delta-12 desaturase)
MRSGPELVRASNEFARDDASRSWSHILVALALYLCLTGVAMAPLPLALRVAASALSGLVLVRLFIFYHDYLHGAMLAGSPAAARFMRAWGWWALTCNSVWRQTHDYHHKNNAKMIGAAIGSYPVVTVSMWRGMTAEQRRAYRLVRHPVNMALGYFTVFWWGMCVSPFRRARQQHREAPWCLVVHFAAIAIVAWALGPGAALLGVVLPQVISCGTGSYLFFAQHNFPDMQLRDRADWEYTFAALRSSSMFDMSPVMHWLTGNIGYHHVHHLNHRIPFYRLPEAMAALPELQSPGRTSWRPRDVIACLSGNVWDPAQGRMVSYSEASQLAAVAA